MDIPSNCMSVNTMRRAKLVNYYVFCADLKKIRRNSKISDIMQVHNAKQNVHKQLTIAVV